MPLEVVFDDVDDDLTLYRFRPEGTAESYDSVGRDHCFEVAGGDGRQFGDRPA